MKALTALLAMLLMVSSKANAQAETFPLVDNTGHIYVQTLEDRERQILCLANNIFYEARGEPKKGKIAVGLVTINRTRDERWDDSICGVVKAHKQFSWYKPGKDMRKTGNTVFKEIKILATMLYDNYYVSNNYVDFLRGATHFHTKSVHPGWRNRTHIATIGNHLFFRVGK